MKQIRTSEIKTISLIDQTGNALRYPAPAHLMLPHPTQRQPIHGSFCNNFSVSFFV